MGCVLDVVWGVLDVVCSVEKYGWNPNTSVRNVIPVGHIPYVPLESKPEVSEGEPVYSRNTTALR